MPKWAVRLMANHCTPGELADDVNWYYWLNIKDWSRYDNQVGDKCLS